tara:strand:+ start:269 stop:1159 length:891 start_codon:yes stop_codon:yes gene_type:complete
MLKKIFKAAKDIIKSPVGQIGIGLLLPGMAGMAGAGGLKGVLGGIGSFAARSPMLAQGALGLLAGDKPANVLRNMAYGTALGGISNLGQPGGFMGGARQSLGMQPTSIAPASVQPKVNQGYISEGADFSQINNPKTIVEQAAKEGPSFLEKLGLVNPEGKDFFEKYGSLVKLGTVGASIAAAALGEDQAADLYDPNKNPYLTSGSGSKDFYEGINPIYSAKGGGISDFPRKTGMIDGPGDGQSDDIPAMLSDGEFVMTKQAVMAAGNGDRDKGTKQMYAMMNGLENKAKEMGIGKF